MYTAPPEVPFPTIDECHYNSIEQTPGQECRIRTLFSLNMSCYVLGYYPGITLYFRHNTTRLETFQTREWNNLDETKSKTITITAEASDVPYTCVAADIPGSGDREHVAIVYLYQPLEANTTTTTTTTKTKTTTATTTTTTIYLSGVMITVTGMICLVSYS